MKGWRWLAAALALGSCLRLQQAWVRYDEFLPQSAPEEGYYEMAVALIGYHVFSTGTPNNTPTAWRGPLFPVLGALAQAGASRPHPGRIRLAVALVSSASVAAAFCLGAVLVSPAAGALAAFAVALEPASVLGSLDIHVFFGCVLLSLAAAAALWAARPTAWGSLGLGLLIGAGLTARGSLFPLPLLLAAAAIRWRLPRRVPAALLLGVALALAPMALRNRLRFGVFLPLPDLHAGAVALLGATAGEDDLNSFTVERALSLAEASEPGFALRYRGEQRLHAEILRVARRRIAAHPWRFAGICLRRLGLLLKALAAPLALALLALALRPGRPMQAAALTALAFGGYAVAGGGADHQAAAWPLLLTLSACGAAALLDRKGRPEPSWSRTLAVGPWALAALYGVFLVCLGLETRSSAAPGPGQERALAGMQVVTAHYRDPAAGRALYAHCLLDNGRRLLSIGDCASASPLLQEALRNDHALTEAAGHLESCRRSDPSTAPSRPRGPRPRPTDS
ncbi:MAG: hypothetical protein AAB320_08425 [Elusimicrobiota bacterium]